MLPRLEDFGIKAEGFIRKLDNRNHWNIFQDSDLFTASQSAAAKVFKERDSKYSLWYVSTNQEFYGIIASLTANANPKDRNIDFIWIAKSELEELNIDFEQVTEGQCLNVKDLHFDAVINNDNAQDLCWSLMSKQRSAQRCKKAQTILILQYQQEIGCRATDIQSTLCECESVDTKT